MQFYQTPIHIGFFLSSCTIAGPSSFPGLLVAGSSTSIQLVLQRHSHRGQRIAMSTCSS